MATYSHEELVEFHDLLVGRKGEGSVIGLRSVGVNRDRGLIEIVVAKGHDVAALERLTAPLSPDSYEIVESGEVDSLG